MLLSLFTTFHGRINRKQWWIGFLLLTLVTVSVQLFLDPDMFSTDQPFVPPLASTVWTVLMLIPDTAITVKRFNDRGWPWWLGYACNFVWLLAFVAPHFGIIIDPDAALPNAVGFWLLFAATIAVFIDNGFLRGEAGANRHGEDPRADGAPTAAASATG